MDVVLLRTLTEKSILNFGKWEGYSIGQMIGLKHTMALRWIYYHYSKITFTPEVLEKIYIFYDDYKIEKPGKDHDMFIKLNKRIWAGMSNEKRMQSYGKNKNVRRGIAKSTIKGSPKKQNLRAKNQGKFGLRADL